MYCRVFNAVDFKIDEKTSAINEKKAKEIEEAKKTLKHADVSGWSRCPSCSYIVEKRVSDR